MTTLKRDNYGSLYAVYGFTSDADRALMTEALSLARRAVKSKKIPASFDNMEWGKSGREKGKQIGDALHHEVYDISPDGRTALICARSVSGDKYGQKTTNKSYFIVRAHGNGVRVLDANKAIAAKAAKSSGEALGDAINVCLGKKKLQQEIITGYKAVARDDAGKIMSIFSGEDYEIGKRKTEAVRENHSGGYYFYETLDEALTAEVPKSSELINLPRVILRCEMSGKTVRYGKKIAATHIKPIEIVASVVRA